MSKHFLLVLVYTITITFSFAQIQTDRPDQTESSATVGAGNLQIESGIQVMYTSTLSSSEREILLPTNLFRYGISDIVELRVVQQIELTKSNSFSTEGVSDLQVGTKLQLLQDESINMEIAYLGHLVLPSQSALNLTTVQNERFYGSIHRLLVSHELNSTMSLGYNLGYQKFSKASGELTYSISLAVAVNPKVGIYIESFGEVDIQNKMLYNNADAGLTYLANPNTQLDLSFGTGIDNRMNYFSMGISLLLQKHPEEVMQ